MGHLSFTRRRLSLAAGAAALAGLLCVCGCGREGAGAEAGRVIVGERSKTIEEMAPGDVIVKVNKASLTRAEYDETLDLWAHLYRRFRPKSTERDAALYRASRARTFVAEYVVKQLLLQEAARQKLRPTPERLADVNNFIDVLAKRDKKTPEDYLRAMGRMGQLIRQDLTDQALIQTLRNQRFGDQLTITEADVNKSKNLITKYNEMCEATNRLVTARGQELCARLRAGEDFAKLADEATQLKDGPGGAWGEFARGEIEDANVRSAAFSLPVGGISEPIDTEEGLVIIKVLERKGVDAAVASDPATVKLARIVLLLGEFKKMPTDDIIRRELSLARLEKLQNAWTDELSKQARVEYPNGTNFWKAAKKGRKNEK